MSSAPPSDRLADLIALTARLVAVAERLTELETLRTARSLDDADETDGDQDDGDALYVVGLDGRRVAVT